MIEPKDLFALMQEVMPIKAGVFRLELAGEFVEGQTDSGPVFERVEPPAYDNEGQLLPAREEVRPLWGTFWLVETEPDGTTIRDMKEQQVFLLRGDYRKDEAPERIRVALQGWAQVLGEVFAQPADQLSWLMPHELVFLQEVLALRRAQSLEDFAKAYRARSRLGKKLPAPV